MRFDCIHCRKATTKPQSVKGAFLRMLTFVICGTDICSVQAMEAYYQIAVEKGCNSNFLEDLKLAIEDFKAFQCEEPEKVKIPD